MKLTDVKCVNCKSVIGQRGAALFVRSDFKIKLNKSARIFCPTCGVEQEFPVNRDKKLSPENLIDKPLFVS